MSQSWLGAGPRIGLGAPDSESSVFFQCHTASEPIPGALFCARFLSLPQLHPWSLQDMGTNHSFPARVPLSLLSSRCAFASLSCSPHFERSFPASVAWVGLNSGPSPFSQVLRWDGEDGWLLSGTSSWFHCLPSEAFPPCFSSGPLSLGALGMWTLQGMRTECLGTGWHMPARMLMQTCPHCGPRLLGWGSDFRSASPRLTSFVSKGLGPRAQGPVSTLPRPHSVTCPRGRGACRASSSTSLGPWPEKGQAHARRYESRGDTGDFCPGPSRRLGT